MSGEGGPLPVHGQLMRPVVATYRPQENDIALFVEDGEAMSAVALSVPEARKIHGALGQALRLADCRDTPLHAVPDHRPVKGAPHA